MKFAGQPQQPFGFQEILSRYRRLLSRLRRRLGRFFAGRDAKLIRFDSKVHYFSNWLLTPIQGIANLLPKIFYRRKTQFWFGVIAGVIFWMIAFVVFKLLVKIF